MPDLEAVPMQIWLSVILLSGVSLWLATRLVPPERAPVRSLRSAARERR